MPPAAPSFPAFEDWKRMSEREQDALLDRLEAEEGRGVTGRRLLIGFGLAAAAVGLVVALVLLSVG